jgi:hypothetical protein
MCLKLADNTSLLSIPPYDSFLSIFVGDIMGGCETSVSIAGAFTPMERVVISANGNLQRIMRYFRIALISRVISVLA